MNAPTAPPRHRLLEELGQLHEIVVAAGKAYVAGEHTRAAELLVDARIEAADLEADIRRLSEAA